MTSLKSVPIPVRRVSAAVFSPHAGSVARPLDESRAHIVHLLGGARAFEVIVEARNASDVAELRRQGAAGLLRVLVGDDSETRDFDLSTCSVNQLRFEICTRTGQVSCSTSVVGLPPVFLLRSEQGDAISAPLQPDRLHGLALGGIDLDAAADVFRWGHPIDGRTMARNLSLAPANARVELGANSRVTITPLATPWAKDEAPAPPVRDLVDAQVDVFRRAAARLDITNAFVSLSGGLDSRAATAAILASGRRATCVTMALTPQSLDARLAAAFCRAYGIEHRTILTDHLFHQGLADRIVRVARLTLGASALHQSIDMFLYEQMGPSYSRRISGNLGNQVGRGGVEGTSAMAHPAGLFSPEMRCCLQDRPLEPWYVDRMATKGFASTLFAEEVNYWSVANMSVGSAHAIQLTPFADRRLLALAAQIFRQLPEFQQPTARQIRLRDVRHRVAGPPPLYSFQRQFLSRYDDRGRNIAVNWGWLARGGWSPPWLARAFPTALSAAVGKFIPAVRREWRVLPPFGLTNWELLVKRNLEELIRDSLGAAAVSQSGVFDNVRLRQAVDRHFRGEESLHGTMTRAFEVALACELIRSSSVAVKPPRSAVRRRVPG
jgi:hypothetical protein